MTVTPPPRLSAPATHDGQRQVKCCGDDRQHQSPVLNLNERAQYPHGRTESGLQVFRIRVHTRTIDRRIDDERPQQPAAHNTHPVCDEVAEPQRVRTPRIRDQIAGINGSGIHRNADQPPRQSSSGQKPVGAGFNSATQPDAIDNDRSIQQDDDQPVNQIHVVSAVDCLSECFRRPRLSSATKHTVLQAAVNAAATHCPAAWRALCVMSCIEPAKRIVILSCPGAIYYSLPVTPSQI